MFWVMGGVNMTITTNQAIQSTFLDYGDLLYPYSSSATTWDGWVHLVVGPYLSSPVMIFAYLLSAACLVACVVAVVRWRYLWVAGTLGLAGGSLFVAGIDAIPASVADKLCTWAGYAGRSPSCSSPVEWPGPGPYFMVLAGAILMGTYALSRRGTLEVDAD
jgi:hypothetical protein